MQLHTQTYPINNHKQRSLDEPIFLEKQYHFSIKNQQRQIIQLSALEVFQKPEKALISQKSSIRLLNPLKDSPSQPQPAKDDQSVKQGVIQENSGKINGHTKAQAYKQKLSKIKARQLQVKKKAESILSNSSSNNSPIKCKSTASQGHAITLQMSSSTISPIKKGIDYDAVPVKQQPKPTMQRIKIMNEGRIQCFLIIKYVDEGCFGKVYLVRHEITGFISCLKMIDRTFLDENNLNQLLREIKIQTFIYHPNIVNLYQFFVDDLYVYLLLEPCLGGNLFKLMNKTQIGCLQQKDVRKYIKQIAKAVEYLHKQDIIHRDIKPENILIHENSAKLCDFGWAVFSPLMRDTQCGTPLYASPQIIKSEYYDSKIDVWCLGVLTYETLYGVPPFKIKNINDMAKIVDEQVHFPRQFDLTSAAIDFIQGCLQKKAVRRFSIKQILDHQFLLQYSASQKYRNTIV